MPKPPASPTQLARKVLFDYDDEDDASPFALSSSFTRRRPSVPNSTTSAARPPSLATLVSPSMFGASQLVASHTHRIGIRNVSRTAVVVAQAIAIPGRIAVAAETLSAAGTGVMASAGVAMAPIAAVAGPIGLALALVDSGFAAFSAVKTYRHIKQLELILQELGAQAMPGTNEAVLFIIKKKNLKLKRKGCSTIPVLGTAVASFHIMVKGIGKRLDKTNGVDRIAHAKTLWKNARAGCACANIAAEEVLGIEVYTLIKDCDDGNVVLQESMKSR